MKPYSPARVVVVGSINMDLVARLEHLPRPGETVHARSLDHFPGGKGANQAVALALLGASCMLVGRVGDDSFGPVLRDHLASRGVGVIKVATSANTPSGIALIGVEDSGQNAITIVAGANGKVTPEDVAQNTPVIGAASALLVQLEIPLPAVIAAIKYAKRKGVLTILDPAPAPSSPLPPEALEIDLLSPNQTEAEALCGQAVTDVSSAALAARKLKALGPKRVVIKLGEQGAYWLDQDDSCGHVPTARIKAVDTTAAGDAFTAALAVALAEGRDLPYATRFGCAAGTLAATRPGAQPSMPTRAEVLSFLEQLP